MAAQEELIKSLKKNYDRKLFAVEVLSPVFGNLLEVYNSLQKPTEQPNTTESKVIEEIGIYGRINLEDDVEVLCYEILLQPQVRIDQSKVAIQHYVRKLLTSGQAALINFVSPTYKDMWRFTLVAKDSELTSQGIQEKATHPKRYTFLVESGRNNKTFAERMEWLSLESDKTMETLVDAFSVEKMSKAFFDEYKEHYQNFVQYLTGKRMVKKGNKWLEEEVGQPNAFLKSIFNGNEKDARDFCKKLLGRIVFLYFVQKKRWLGASDTEYEDGSQNFVFEIFEETGGNEDFFPHGLTELFFNVLNKERPNDLYETPKGEQVCIPYLNGGLFTRDEVDELLHKKGDIMTFPYKLFSNEEKKEDPLPKNASIETDDSYEYRGFLDFLNAFNFTVYEDSQDDYTVAVDPEMLGHIFENLLEDNKDKGAYYTPKEIVNYMCQESLLEYLNTHLGDKTDKEELGRLVREKEPNHLSKEVLKAVNEKLDEVKICDPAIGSGAFPMGLLQEIFSIKEIIAYQIDLDWDPAKAKEDIIQNSIYGVDIEKGAVDIARLRFWLSLVVDKDKPKALPNLDYKIVVGDSLVPKFEDEIIQIEWDVKKFTSSDEADRNKIQKLSAQIATEQRKFFNPNLKDKKKLIADIRVMKLDLLETQLSIDYKRKIGGLTKHLDSGLGLSLKQLKENQERDEFTNQYNRLIRKIEQLRDKTDAPFFHFDWRLDFPAIFNPLLPNKELGFDIIIGNPPWGASFEPKELKQIKKKHKDIIRRMTDSFMFFINESLSLVKDNGVVSQIIPEVILNQQDNDLLRLKILENYHLTNVVNLGDNIFRGVTRASCIIQVKIDSIKEYSYNVGRFEKVSNKVKFLYEGDSVDSDLVKSLPYNIFPTQQLPLYRLLKELKGFDLLKDLLDEDGIQRGVSPDFKKAFIVDDATISKYQLEREFLRRTVTGGKDVKRYYYSWKGDYVIYTRRDVDKAQIPKIIGYLTQFKKDITCKEVIEGKHPFYSLHRSRNEKIFNKKSKILGVITGDKIIVSHDSGKLYPTDGIYLLSASNVKLNDVLVGILNSKLLTVLYRLYSNEKGKILAQVKPMVLGEIPIPPLSDKDVYCLTSMVSYVSFLRTEGDSELKEKLMTSYFEQIIDGITYELYFPYLLKKFDRQIIRHLGELPAFKDSMSYQEKLSICKGVFERLDDKEHPVRNNIFYMDSIPEIRIIEGKDEDH